MYSDLPVDQLATYRGTTSEPKDFDAFWEDTLDDARLYPLALKVTPYPATLRTVELYDVVFSGFGGELIRAWLRLPAQPLRTEGPIPGVVQFAGYGGGRGDAHENLFWASAGFAHLHMDSRGQGAGWSKGATPDGAGSAGPQGPGVMTRGILDPETYYYRRLFTDAVRAVQALRSLDSAEIGGPDGAADLRGVVDPDRVAVLGQSQGGSVALAAGAFCPEVAAVVAFVPYLADIPRAVSVTDAYPFREVCDFLAVHRGSTDRVMETLRYFDAIHLARRSAAPALFSVGLMDTITPPSTVYAAYNNYAGPKDLEVWPFNGHEAGGIEDELAALDFLQRQLGDG
ncbi:acetylxylan esterase [Arthrobacter sp. zg-Y411]|uniref:acetylxylan esterase n=1 Tax=Arthrobacter zhangbolii TaxID=2886936 RepID=UPI001D14E5DF|nr:acetylxylan esterase [Arthrobacter zhangbolii]MCC3295100.1 acetylxylan esterase [Arthrobacter zhangbolii]